MLRHISGYHQVHNWASKRIVEEICIM